VLALTFGAFTLLTANAEDLPIQDPDGVGGPPLVRLSAILSVFMLLDVLPRAFWRKRRQMTRIPHEFINVIRERWTGKRLALVLVGLFSFYITYVAYRNLKGFLPFLQPDLHDTSLLELDRDMFFGHDPSTVLHTLLGTGFANSFLSAIYVFFLAFVPISLAAALVWFADLRHGLWYATALCFNWVLGTLSYYLIPAMGPAFVAPELFADLAPSSSSALQHSLWAERLNVVYGHAPGPAKDLLQSIAAFASLHVSVTLTAALVAHLLSANRWLRYALWLYAGLVAVATIYLGWHYVVDDFAGVAIAYLSVAIGAVATGHSMRRRGNVDVVHNRGAGSSGGGGSGASVMAAVRLRMPEFTAGGLNAPNVLSGVRILIAPAIVAVVLAHPDGSVFAAALFAAGALTDIVDGHLARTRGLITPLGKLLDPFADKLLVLAALISLVAVDRLQMWVVGVIAAREILVTMLRAHAMRQGVVIAAGPAGKLKMFFQSGMVVALLAVSDPFATWVELLVAATVALTVVSGLDYVRAYLKGRPAAAPAV
jgi:CDP-diacylglycerol--glycerol-3-phosphate 3-phosphatidyltransferase